MCIIDLGEMDAPVCLLDIYFAFDTINHSFFLHRISYWFGVSVTVIYSKSETENKLLLQL